MSAEYQIRLYNAAGSLQAIITDYLYLTYTKRVNQSGLCRFQLGGNNQALFGMVGVIGTSVIFESMNLM